MDLSHGHRTFATLRHEAKVFSMPAVGSYRFIVEIVADVHPRDVSQSVEVLVLEGTLSAAGEHVGYLRPLGMPGLSTSTGPGYAPSLQFALDLDARHVESLQELFSVGAIRFEATFTGVACGPAGTTRLFTSGGLAVTREQWLAALQGSGFGRIVTAEVLVPESGDPRLRKAVDALAMAIQLKSAGEARQSVGHCRVAMDQAGLDRKNFFVNLGKSLEALTFEERVKFVRSALYAFCSPAQHSLTQDYGTDEARLAVGLTAVLLEYEARKRQG